MKGVGRPRNFDTDAALRRAVDVFWEKGYAVTSLNDLLSAMGIARSSFYAIFGSKHAVMLSALKLYTEELLGRMKTSAAQNPKNPREALRAVLRIAACSVRPANGCLFVNMATELAQTDEAVRSLGRSYLKAVDRLFTSLLVKCGNAEDEAHDKSIALMALATGAVTLSKAGQPHSRIGNMLMKAEHLIDG